MKTSHLIVIVIAGLLILVISKAKSIIFATKEFWAGLTGRPSASNRKKKGRV